MGSGWKAVFRRPKAQAGVGNEEDLFAVHRVPAIAKAIGVVASGVVCEIAVLVMNGFNLLTAKVTGAVPDDEAAFRGAVNQVGGGA